MKKVFNVIVHYVYEMDSTITVKTFATKELARQYFLMEVEDAREEAANSMDEDDLVIDFDPENLSFNAYKDGNASEWEANVYVEETEVCDHIETNYHDQRIIQFANGVEFFLFGESGEPERRRAGTVEEAKEIIDGICDEQGGLYNADGELVKPEF